MSSDPDVMTDGGENQEPTMEEILASIRRIISEDGDGAAEGAEAAAEDAGDATLEEAPEPAIEEAPEPEPEVQAEFADEEPAPEPEPEPDATDAGILELTEVAEAADAEFGQAEGIASDEASSTAGQSFDHLSALMVSGYPGADNTLEGLLREMLKPMLKAYLDENLPRIVHELVDQEVARISRRR